jgi:hypothetical protein
MHTTTSLYTHMLYVAMMLCCLFGKKNPTHFSVEWVAIMNEIVEGYTFNWYIMLSGSLAKEITNYKLEKSKGHTTPFYMSAYVMDAICFMTPLPLLNSSWTPTNSEPIHFFHSKLWEDNAKDLLYEICHNVVVLVHIAIDCHPSPRISERIMGNLGNLAGYLIEENLSYIKVFGCSVPPHSLPHFLHDMLVCREVAYRIVP